MTGVLIKQGNLYTTRIAGKAHEGRRGKTAVSEPRREPGAVLGGNQTCPHLESDVQSPDPGDCPSLV